MALIQSRFAKRQLPIINAAMAGDVVCNDYFVDLATTDMIAGNIIDLGMLPAYHTVTDAMLIPDDIDSGTTVTLDVGLMSGTFGDNDNTRTCGAEIFSASTAAQTGSVVASSLPSAFKILSTERDRSIGVKIVAAPTTPVAGRIRVRVRMHVSDQNVQF